MNDIDFTHLIEGCRRYERASQQRLYALFYHYAMSVARRYCNDNGAAGEISNDAFFKIFTKIDQYRGDLPFKQWLRRIVVNTAIDRFRANVNTPKFTELPAFYEPEVEPDILEALTRADIMSMLDQLPPGYRAVFNLYVVDGFSHEEVSAMLGISVGTSKSNLSRARMYLKTLLENEFDKTRRQ